MAKPMREEAYELNFIKDVVRIGKEVEKTLHSSISRDKKVIFVENIGAVYGGSISVYDTKDELAGDLWRVEVNANIDLNKKIKYKIDCGFYNGFSIGIRQRRNVPRPYLHKEVEVSNNREYTKAEIKKAR